MEGDRGQVSYEKRDSDIEFWYFVPYRWSGVDLKLMRSAFFGRPGSSAKVSIIGLQCDAPNETDKRDVHFLHGSLEVIVGKHSIHFLFVICIDG